MDVMNDFDRWKEFLGSHVDKAQAMGLSDEAITEMAEKIGDFLAESVTPKTPQDQLLKQLWENSSAEEQKTLARMVVKLADKAH